MSDFIFNIDIEVIIKLSLSAMIGMLVGKERKKHSKPGGSRTVAIVCLGATLMGILNLELISMAGLSDLCRINIARIPAYCLVAIGFLGSGLITKTKQGIEGLTSASVLFSIVPIGVALGMGFFQLAGIASILLFLTLEMKYIKRR